MFWKGISVEKYCIGAHLSTQDETGDEEGDRESDGNDGSPPPQLRQGVGDCRHQNFRCADLKSQFTTFNCFNIQKLLHIAKGTRRWWPSSWLS